MAIIDCLRTYVILRVFGNIFSIIYINVMNFVSVNRFCRQTSSPGTSDYSFGILDWPILTVLVTVLDICHSSGVWHTSCNIYINVMEFTILTGLAIIKPWARPIMTILASLTCLTMANLG